MECDGVTHIHGLRIPYASVDLTIKVVEKN